MSRVRRYVEVSPLRRCVHSRTGLGTGLVIHTVQERCVLVFPKIRFALLLLRQFVGLGWAQSAVAWRKPFSRPS